MNLEDRLISRRHIDIKTGCWVWMGARHVKNYGLINVLNKSRRVHRIAYEEWVGPIGNLLVLHKCDNPPCFNPDHLYLGTNRDNNDDKVNRNRQSKGEKHGRLSDEEIRQIKRRAKAGEKLTDIARDFGIDPSYVSRLKSGDRNYRKDVS